MKRMSIGSSLLALLVVIGCGSGKPQDASATNDAAVEKPIQLAEAPAVAPAAAPASGSASITGHVKLTGTAPARAKIKMDADPFCVQQHTSPVLSEDAIVGGQGELANVFVYVKDGVQGSYPAPTTPVVLTQKGCWYTPHVFGIQSGQPLEVVNEDATMHNVNAKPKANTPFNLAQPKPMKSTKAFSKPEVPVSFKCNVHPWMTAYAGVVAHPFFAVSGADGSFTISGLPAGTYTVEAWQEKFGAQSQSVTVADGESKAVEFTFKAE